MSAMRKLPVVPIRRRAASLILPAQINDIFRYLVPTKRGVAHRHDVGCGRRWTRAMSATNDIDPRTAKSCGPDIPTLISSLAKTFSARRRWQESPVTEESAL